MNVKILGYAVFFGCSAANASIVLTSYGTLGVDLQESYSRLQANARGGGDEQLAALTLPSSTQMTASSIRIGDSSFASITAQYSLDSDRLAVDITNISRGGPSGAGSNGAWLFSVTETAQTSVTGFLDARCCSYSNENHLRASLFDLTAGLSLFESIQDDHATGLEYSLGGLIGNRSTLFSGNLENVLVPDHVYRLAYSLGVSNPEAAADSSHATGMIVLQVNTVPQPSSWALTSAALFALALTTRRIRGRAAR